MNYNQQDLINIQQEAFKFIYKKEKNKGDIQTICQLLKKWPNEIQHFRQYCVNSKVFSIGDIPKYVYIVTKGEFTLNKYVKSHSKNPLAYISKIFSQEAQYQKISKTLKSMESFAIDEIYNEKHTYEVTCQSIIGEVFCIKKVVFDKILDKKLFQPKKPNLQIQIEQIINDKPQVLEIQSAKGSTPMNRLHLGNIPRQPEEISTHRHEKKTIDFNFYRNGPLQKKVSQHIKVIKEEEIEEPPLNDRYLGVE